MVRDLNARVAGMRIQRRYYCSLKIFLKTEKHLFAFMWGNPDMTFSFKTDFLLIINMPSPFFGRYKTGRPNGIFSFFLVADAVDVKRPKMYSNNIKEKKETV